LETRGAVAGFDAATGRVTLSTSTQMPHLLRTGIAGALGIPEAEFRVSRRRLAAPSARRWR